MRALVVAVMYALCGCAANLYSLDVAMQTLRTGSAIDDALTLFGPPDGVMQAGEDKVYQWSNGRCLIKVMGGVDGKVKAASYSGDPQACAQYSKIVDAATQR